MSPFDKTIALHADDLPQTLFPLHTNQVLISLGSSEIAEYVYTKIRTSTTADAAFLPQERVYAAKPSLHLRRTQKLDPIAEFFIYDLVYRHRAKFRGDILPNRRSFGYRFDGGVPISPSDSYREFKEAIIAASRVYKYYCRFDIACYFNSIYHHDLEHWFETIAETDVDHQLFGKFLRQINAGRSVDCLTHGILPTKILGSHFLKPIETYPGIRSPLLLRFMDDFYLFADDWGVIGDDFIIIQKLLGERGLSINPSKTTFAAAKPTFIDGNVNEVRLALLKRKRRIFRSSGLDDDDDDEKEESLSPAEMEYLVTLLHSPNMDEDDAELILALMRENGDAVVEHLDKILASFPHLARNVAVFCDHITDDSALLLILINHLKKHEVMTEYQLFWIARIVEMKLLKQPGIGELITLLYEHKSASKISKAKLLEIPTAKYGLKERRSEQLRTGGSDWLSWSAAVGTRGDTKASRNYTFGYFANGSQMNGLIASILKKL